MNAARTLLCAKAVRERSHEMLRLAEAGGLPEWQVDRRRLGPAADLVAETIRQQYPTLDVPFHARWRHFVADGHDLWAQIDADQDWDRDDRARAAFDLAIVSVLLDAGSGPAWRFLDVATGTTLGRSEGLGIASLRMFQGGTFAGNPRRPLRADAVALASVSAAAIGAGFQVSDDNPMVGLEGRAGLLRRLGERALAAPDLFGLKDAPRPGGLFDAMADRADRGRLPAPVILEVLLEALGPIWEGRLSLEGEPLGDTWRHPALKRDDATDGLVPLHKLSQWLAYSLIEPLEDAGVSVTEIDGLTGLAEYRNGGLLIDTGVLVPADAEAMIRTYAVSDPLVVGWRALTVALLDEIAPLVRERLGVGADAFPLARVLEGGTWAAGRKIAAITRIGGGPPLNITSDGTVF